MRVDDDEVRSDLGVIAGSIPQGVVLYLTIYSTFPTILDHGA